MNSLFESIKQGLNEAIEYERSNLPNVRVDKITVAPLHTYTSSREIADYYNTGSNGFQNYIAEPKRSKTLVKT